MKRNYWIILATILIFTGITVKSNAQTVANFSFSNNCYGSQTIFTSTTTTTYTVKSYNWDWNNDSIFTDDTGFTVKHSFAFADTFRVGLQVFTSNDTSVVYKNVIIQMVLPIFTINADSQCLKGNNFIFTNTTTVSPSGTFTSIWNFDDATTSTLTNPVHSYTQQNKTYKVKLITTSNFGCVDSIINNAIVLPNPVVSFSNTDTINCIGENFLFTNNSTIPYGTMQYLWDYGDGNQTNTVNGVNSYAAVGSYVVTLKVTSNKGCSDSSKQTIHVDTNLIADFAITPNDTQCGKTNGFFFTSTSNVCGTTDSVLWDIDGNGTFGEKKGLTANSAYVTPQTISIGMIVFSGSKSDTAFHNIVINPSPVAGFSINNSTQALTGNYFIFTNSSSITPSSTLTYNWNFGDGGSSVVTSPGYSYASAGSFKVLLTVTSNKGCTDTLSKYVSVTAPIAANFTADTVCFNDSTSFTNTSVSGEPILQINWDFNNDSLFVDGSGNNVKHLFTTPGLHTVGLEVVTASTSDTVFKQILVNPKPVAGFSINNATQYLTGNNFIFTNTSTITPSSTLTYLWDFKDGNTTTMTNVSHTYGAVGNYYVLLKVTSLLGCTDTISKKATVLANSVLQADFKADTVCYPGIATFTNTSTSSYPILKINWDLDNDKFFDDGTGQTVKYQVLSNGNFTAGIQVITAVDTSEAYKVVIVNSKPRADFLINRVSQPLAGNLFMFSNSSTITPFSPMTFNWTFGDGGVSNAVDVNHSYAALGNYNVTLIATSDKGCKDTLVKQVSVVNYTLTVDFSFNNACLGDTTFFTNLTTVSNDSIINYLWDFGDGSPTIVRINPKHYYSSTGTYNVSLVVLLLSGNKDTLTQQVPVYANPVVTIDYAPDTNVYVGQTVTLSVPGIWTSYLWSTGSTNSSIDVTTEGLYSVTATDDHGCKDSATRQLIFKGKTAIEIVTGISPNGDGINDVWKIINLGAYGKCEVKIINRWGDVVYESSDYKNDWDGTYKGQKLPEGTYYYMVNTPNDGTFTGPVNILK